MNNHDNNLVDFMGGAVPHQEVQWQHMAAGAAFGYYMSQQLSPEDRININLLDQSSHYYYPPQQQRLYTSGDILWTFIKMVLLWAVLIGFWVWLLT